MYFPRRTSRHAIVRWSGGRAIRRRRKAEEQAPFLLSHTHFSRRRAVLRLKEELNLSGGITGYAPGTATIISRQVSDGIYFEPKIFLGNRFARVQPATRDPWAGESELARRAPGATFSLSLPLSFSLFPRAKTTAAIGTRNADEKRCLSHERN